MTLGSDTDQVEPVRIRNETVFRWWDYPIYAALTVVQLAVLVYAGTRWIGSGWITEHPVVFVVMTPVLLGFVGAHLLRWLQLPKMRRPVAPEPVTGRRVAAVTTFVPGGESIEMLGHTVRAMVAMDEPHDTWVLDEGDSGEVRALCERLGAKHFTRSGVERYQQDEGVFQRRSKHGNYNAFFDAVGYDRYDIIAGFDPDHVPERGFLTRVLGYFRDPSIAYVQLPQVYYNQSAGFIARGGAEETYSYYDTTQPAAHGGGWPIVTGCHHTHRVAALRQINGFAPHDADDLLITYCYMEAGWRGVYSPEIQARGITPVDWAGYLRQQYRWAHSVLDIKLRLQPKMNLHLPWHELLICYFHGFYYIRGVANLAGTLLIMYMLLTGDIPGLASSSALGMLLLLVGLFYACDHYRQRFYIDLRRQVGVHWRAAILQYAKWPVMLLALADVVRGKTSEYTLTRKIAGRNRSWSLILPHAVIGGCLLGSWIVAVVLGHRNAAIEAWAIGMAAVSLLLVASEFLRYPPPYDESLWLREQARPVPAPGCPFRSADPSSGRCSSG